MIKDIVGGAAYAWQAPGGVYFWLAAFHTLPTTHVEFINCIKTFPGPLRVTLTIFVDEPASEDKKSVQVSSNFQTSIKSLPRKTFALLCSRDHISLLALFLHLFLKMAQPPSQGNAQESRVSIKLPQFASAAQSRSEQTETVGVPSTSVLPFLVQVEHPTDLPGSDVKARVSSDLSKESMPTTLLMSKRKLEEPEAKELALTESETKKPRVSEKIASASVLSVALPEDPNDWTVDDVYLWAIESVGLDTEDASILKNQKVNGKALLTLTEEELQKILPLGPATLETAIKELKKQVSIPEIVKRGKVLGSRLQPSTIPMNPEWVDRWGIKDRIDNLFVEQMAAYLYGNREQDFRFWVIAGGSGIGKTRTGQELPRLLAEKLKNNNAHSVHTFIRVDSCPLQFPLKDVGDADNACIADNIAQAGKWLSLGIAAWYFAHNYSDSTLRVFQGDLESFSDFIVVIKAIRLSEQMKGVVQEDQTLVLFLQIDEFQRNIPLVRAALRFIRNRHLDSRNNKVLMIPILTGTYPHGIEELQKNCCDLF
jgi:hypothetical protein